MNTYVQNHRLTARYLNHTFILAMMITKVKINTASQWIMQCIPIVVVGDGGRLLSFFLLRRTLKGPENEFGHRRLDSTSKRRKIKD